MIEDEYYRNLFSSMGFVIVTLAFLIWIIINVIKDRKRRKK